MLNSNDKLDNVSSTNPLNSVTDLNTSNDINTPVGANNANPAMSASDKNFPSSSPGKNSKKMAIIGFAVLIITLTGVSFLSYNAGKKSVQEKPPEEEKIDFIVESNPQKPSPSLKQEKISPTSEPVPKTITKIVSGEAELDGYVSSGQTVSNTESNIKVGRNRDEVTRGFVSFDLSELPGGITIRAANLRIYQTQTTNAPYITSGDIRIDHISYGNTLDNDDYSLPALLNNIATLSTSKRIGWKVADVTALVRDDITNARTSSQFRLHFSKELTGGDERGDFAYFVSSNSKASVNKPQLVVEYY